MTPPAVRGMALAGRLRLMMLGWCSVAAVYFGTGYLDVRTTLLAESAFDRMIAYDASAIWLYLSFFLVVPYAYLAADAPRARWLARSMALCALLSGLVFVAFPSTMHYPSTQASESGIGGALLRLLVQSDSHRNCLPSLHAALTMLCVWALVDARRALRSVLVLAWGAGICLSVIQLRRHLGIDLAAGLLVAFVSGSICKKQALFARRQPESPL